MKFLRSLLAAAIVLLTVTPLAAQPQMVRWKTDVKHVKDDIYKVTFEASIDPGWHMYDMGPYEGGPIATSFNLTPSAGMKLSGGVKAETNAKKVMDPNFMMEVGYYENKVVFAQEVKLTGQKATLTGTAEWQLCDDTSCMPPMEEEFNVEIVRAASHRDPAAAQAQEATVASGTQDPPSAAGSESGGETPAEVGSAEGGEVTAEGQQGNDATVAPADTQAAVAPVSGSAEDGGGWSGLWTAILFGLAAFFTPCVFPMAPMTVSFFMKGEGGAKAGRFKALMYGIFIVAIYTIPIAALILITKIVGGDAVTADIFNWISTHWLPNIIFFLVFMIFAASFFGAFEIVLPSWIVNKSDSKSDKKGLGGIFFMALTLVLVSFSCTGPLVSSVVVDSISGTTNVWKPIINILAFSIAFALPFTLLALFPQVLNKVKGGSGGWLNSVKVVIGFVEVALGFKFLSVADQTYQWGLLDREIYLAIWIVVFTLLGFYLLGKIKFKHDSDLPYIGVGRLSLAIITFTFVVYMVPGMWGAPLKGLSGYMPPLTSQDFVLTSGGSGAVASGSGDTGMFINPITNQPPRYSDQFKMPNGMKGFFDLNEGAEYARSVGKPLFIDLTGLSCTNCREMESRVWTDPEVANLLNNEFVKVALFLDAKVELPENEWVTDSRGRVMKTVGKVNSDWAYRNYGTVAMPYYIIVDDNGQVLVPPRGYDRSIPDYVKFLQDGIAAYKAKK